MFSIFSRRQSSRAGFAAHNQDLLAVSIALAGLTIFAGIADSPLERLRAQIGALDAGNAGILVGLILLNVAATIFGWRRYRMAVAEARLSTARAHDMRSAAFGDVLTGFHNRAGLAEALGQSLLPAAAERRAVAVMVLDLDGIRTVSDVHGPITADKLVRIAAEIIRSTLPGDAVLGRLGPDTFAAAYAFDPADQRQVDLYAAHLAERLGTPVDLAGAKVHSGASIGIARSDVDEASADALLRRADIAMHAARKQGPGRFIWFDASMQRELQSRNRIEAGLRTGIPAGAFVPYFEPQIDLASGDLQGFEMLARWNHPERGIVAPDEFIGIAEECGLIGDLSLSVMRQALAEARGWDNSLTLAVNISPIQLKDPWLAQKLAKLLSETGYPAERLEVEITESALFENLGLAQAIVLSLKNQGIRLALDDFGTGYSSLAHLRALPFDRIKIDRSFIASLNDNPESEAMVMAITRVAESFNLSVTAEGVETAAIESRLRLIGNYCGQGWLLGKPMPVEDVRSLLAGNGLLPARRDHRVHAIGKPGGEKVRRAG